MSATGSAADKKRRRIVGLEFATDDRSTVEDKGSELLGEDDKSTVTSAS